MSVGGSALVDIGSCNIHTVHNSFKAGISSVCHWSVDELLTDIFYFFKQFPARQEDYEILCDQLGDDDISSKFMRFVECRWLSMSPVAARVLDNWERLLKFFLEGKFDKQLTESPKFKRIGLHLQANKITKARLHFICAVSSDFEKFLRMFQVSAPLIHMLHDKLTELIRNLLHRFVKAELVTGKPLKDLLDIKLSSENYVTAEKFVIGSDAKKIMGALKAEKADGAYTACRTHEH